MLTRTAFKWIGIGVFLAAMAGCATKHGTTETTPPAKPAIETPAPVASASVARAVAPPDDPRFKAEVDRLVAKYGERLTHSHYMEQGAAKDVTFPGWDGFPLKRYTYSVTDKTTGVKKTADVVMLNASPEKLSRWIVRSYIEVTGDIAPASDDKMFERVIGQSGGQFPVAGVVYEDIIPADGVNEIYCFRDGVTVKIDGITHRGTDPMTPEQIETSITGTVTHVFTYGRVQSTTPGQYTRNGGTLDVGDDQNSKPAWMDAIRESYQKAWNSDYNSLMIACARDNI